VGKSGGKKKQKQAKKQPVADDCSKAKKGDAKCAKPKVKSYLKVIVLRSDTDEGVESISVKAKPPGGGPLSGTTVKKTGLADFGEVAPKTYDVTVELTEDQKKIYKEPDPSSTSVPEGTTRTHTVTLDPLCTLRVIILGYDAKNKKDDPVKGRDWEYSAPSNKKGKTPGNGLISIDVLTDDDKAVLEVKLRDPPPPAGADPAVATAPEDYPIKIKADAWKDKDDGDVLPPREDDAVKWRLSIIDQDDADNDDGVKGRLHNMAFPANAGADATATKNAVEAYQLLYDDERDGSGKLSDIEAAVKKKHDEE
jgi:hypothetical protein